VTTDLSTYSARIFTRGPLEVAIRASCAFPGLFEPVEHEGRLLADGCIVAPVPTQVAARMSGDLVIGVSVGSCELTFGSAGHVAKVQDRSTVRSNRNPADASWTRYEDVFLEPAVHHIEWNDFSRATNAREAGVNAMRLALPAVREMLDRRNRSAISDRKPGQCPKLNSTQAFGETQPELAQ
jgi:NTE family protein